MKIFLKSRGKDFSLLRRLFSFIKKNNFKNLKISALVLTSLAFLASTPLFFSNKAILKGFIYSSLSKVDKVLGITAIELIEYGFNPFLLSKRYIRSQFHKEEILNLDINFKNFSKLQVLRDKAIDQGLLERSPGDDVNANINYKGVNYPVRIRLKGDFTDHLIGQKWSYKVRTKDDNSFLGMNEFSMLHPRTRTYINEYIFHKLLEYENLPYLRYKFIPLRLNGKYLGTYALEEHFDKNLIENSQYREGPIIRISDDDIRSETRRVRNIDGSFHNHTNFDINNAEIKTFNFSKLKKNEQQINQYQFASNLFEMYLNNKIHLSKVFDIDKTAKFFAINDLLQANYEWDDMTFYFNPITARIIPIGYNAEIPIKIKSRILSKDVNVLNLFDHKLFIEKYIQYLEEFSKKEYLNKFIEEINIDLQNELLSINKSYPFVRFSKENILKNQEYIKIRLSPLNPIGIKSFQIDDNNLGRLEFEVYNKSSLPIEILKIEIGNYSFDEGFNNNLLPINKLERIKPQIISLKSSSEIFNKQLIMQNDLIISYKISGSSKQRVFKTNNQLPIIKDSLLSKKIVLREPSYKVFESLKVNHIKKEIIVEKNLKIDSPLILPKTYKLLIKEGSEIQLEKNGLIIVQGKLLIKGSLKNPVKIKAKNGGRGILVLNANSVSEIKNAIFEELSAPSIKGMNVTGGLSFYESPVNIEKSLFINSKSEDALNLFRSSFELNNVTFEDINSDAIDLDFSNGKIINSRFSNIGNDAVDLSGSSVNLSRLSFENIGDKGISLGERSKLSADKIDIKNAFIGVASKDLSYAKLNKISILNTSICMAAYQKKKEYGPGIIEVNKYSQFNNNKISCSKNYLLERGSKINKLIPNTKNLYLQIYGNN